MRNVTLVALGLLTVLFSLSAQAEIVGGVIISTQICTPDEAAGATSCTDLSDKDAKKDAAISAQMKELASALAAPHSSLLHLIRQEKLTQVKISQNFCNSQKNWGTCELGSASINERILQLNIGSDIGGKSGHENAPADKATILETAKALDIPSTPQKQEIVGYQKDWKRVEDILAGPSSAKSDVRQNQQALSRIKAINQELTREQIQVDAQVMKTLAQAAEQLNRPNVTQDQIDNFSTAVKNWNP